MTKSSHRAAQRVVLPNGMWVLIYDNGHVKLAGYDREMVVTEVLNRDGGSQVFVKVTEKPGAKTVAARRGDLVTVDRSVLAAISGLQIPGPAEAAQPDEAPSDGP